MQINSHKPVIKHHELIKLLEEDFKDLSKFVLKNPEARILSIDYGRKIMGLAISSFIANLPKPEVNLKTQNRCFWSQLSGIISNQEIVCIILGYPVPQDNREIIFKFDLIQFYQALKNKYKKMKIPIYFIDESFTTYEAQEIQKKLKPYNYDKRVDSIAASILLQRAFDSIQSLQEGESLV